MTMTATTSPLLQDATKTAQEINFGGWIFMLLSVGFVTVLIYWCFKKVLSLPPEK
jgi:hypothetical protein